jgi:hypothetical protein
MNHYVICPHSKAISKQMAILAIPIWQNPRASHTCRVGHMHARRYFDKALANDQQRASNVLKLIQLLYAIEALVREDGMTQ